MPGATAALTRESLLSVAPLCEAALYSTAEGFSDFAERGTLRARLARLLSVTGGMWALEVLGELLLQTRAVAAAGGCTDSADDLARRRKVAAARARNDALLTGARFMLRNANDGFELGPLTWRQMMEAVVSDDRLASNVDVSIAGHLKLVMLVHVLYYRIPLPGLWHAAPALKTHAPGTKIDTFPSSIFESEPLDECLAPQSKSVVSYSIEVCLASAQQRARAIDGRAAGSMLQDTLLAFRALPPLGTRVPDPRVQRQLLASGGAGVAERILARGVVSCSWMALYAAQALVSAMAPALTDMTSALALIYALSDSFCNLCMQDSEAYREALSMTFDSACDALFALLTGGAESDCAPHAEATRTSASPVARAVAAVLLSTECGGISNPAGDAAQKQRGILQSLLRCAVRLGKSSNVKSTHCGLRSVGRLFRALVAQPRGDGVHLADSAAQNVADVALQSSARLLSRAIDGRNELVTTWLMTYALLPRAYVDVVVRRRHAAALASGLSEIAATEVAAAPVPFCLAQCCAPRRDDGGAAATLIPLLSNNVTMVYIMSCAAQAHQCRASVARFIAYMFQGCTAGLDPEALIFMRAALLTGRLACFIEAAASVPLELPAAVQAAHDECLASCTGRSSLAETPTLALLAELPLLSPVLDDADEPDLLYAAGCGPHLRDDDGGANLSDWDEDETDSPERVSARHALLLDRALCAVTGAARADGQPGPGERAAAASAAASAAAARADAAMAALLAEEEAEAEARGGTKGKRSSKKNRKSKPAKPAAATAALPSAAEPAGEADADTELDAAAMARALGRGGGAASVSNTARVAASVVVAAPAPIVERGAPPSTACCAHAPQLDSARRAPETSSPAQRKPPSRQQPQPQQPPQQATHATPDVQLAALFPGLSLASASPAAPPSAPQPAGVANAGTADDSAHEDDALCICCLDSPRDTALPGCAGAHADVLCAPCAALLCDRPAPVCPLCREPVVPHA